MLNKLLTNICLPEILVFVVVLIHVTKCFYSLKMGTKITKQNSNTILINTKFALGS